MARPRRTGEGPSRGAADPGEPGRDTDEAPRGRERSQLRAALALEEAGELQEAARMFEYVGEHAQAASLRLEHADTLRDEQQRLAVLREGCARNPANSAQGQALHRALGEALLRVAEGLEPGARRRALALEAAQALEDGQRAAQAGRLYEQLGLLTRATKAYTEAGDIERLESVLAVLDQRDQRQRELRNLELEVESALETGRRGLARALVLEHARDAQRDDQTPNSSLAQTLADLERRTPRERTLGLAVRMGGAAAGTGPAAEPSTWFVRVLGGPQLRIGRGPQCELAVSGAAISREHVELALVFRDDGEPDLVVRDLGSRAGSFLDGEVLVPGEDESLLALEGDHDLALGIATSFELKVHGRPRPVAILREAGLGSAPAHTSEAWTVYLPLGGPLWITPDRALPVSVEFEADQALVRAAADVQVALDGRPVGPGEAVELLIHDRLQLRPAHGEAFEIEVRPPW